MSEESVVRWGWLKAMYIWTIVGAGGFGLGLILVPDLMGALFGWPQQAPLLLGVSGAVNVAFAVVAIFGLRSPLKFVPVLFLSLCYKSIWFIALLLPALVRGQLPGYGVMLALVFATYIIGELIAIPFRYLFRREAPGTVA